MSGDDFVRHRGGCHCGRIGYEVEAPPAITAYECNCSICRLSGYLHLIVPAARFHLLRGEEDLVSYRFNSGVANHLFCGICGIKSFYVPRSHPDGISVNVRCLDEAGLESVTVAPFDGANWEDNIGQLRR